MNPPSPKRLKLNESENEDRLSDLHDYIILHILSFLNAKDAVGTCILSPRYKDLWKQLPNLTFRSYDFRTYKIFTNFVSNVLSLRDSPIALHALECSKSGCIEPRLLKKVVNYAISHNVQELEISYLCDIELISNIIFSCKTLTCLKLSAYPRTDIKEKTLFPKSLNLPALTILHLGNFAFCASDNNAQVEPFSTIIDNNAQVEPFSTFKRLHSLVLNNCALKDAVTLCISSATLVNFTLSSYSYDFYKIELCTPSLGTFAFIGKPYQRLSGSSLSYVKHVDIDAEFLSMEMEPPLFLLNWLFKLTNTKSLTVTASSLQVLSLNSNLLKTELPSLGNLKSLKVKRKPLAYIYRKMLLEAKLQETKSRKEAAKLRKSFKAGLEPFAPIPDGIINFLLQNSPSAEVYMVDC